MSDEGRRAPGPERPPAPPAASRRAGNDAVEATGLVPPFLPGRAHIVEDTPPASTGAGGAGAAREEAVQEAAAAVTVEPEPVVAPDDAFPFELGDAPEATAGTGPGQAPATPASGVSGGTAEEGEPEDEFPFDAFGLTGELPAASSAEAGTVESNDAVSAADSLAERLESLAARLRAEGASAAEIDMASSDRFTSLLGAILAGYLAAAHD